jgi:hypothetical protein
MDGYAEYAPVVGDSSARARKRYNRCPGQRLLADRVSHYAFKEESVGIGLVAGQLRHCHDEGHDKSQQYRKSLYGHLQMNDYLCISLYTC